MVKCLEKYAARTVAESEETKTAETVWNVFGALDENAASASLGAVLPSTYTFPGGAIGFVNNVALKDVTEVDPAATLEQQESVLSHQATVTYSTKQPKVEDLLEYEFDTTSTETITLTHALATTGISGGGRLIPNFRGGINPKSDGSLAGIQTEEPIFTFKLTKHWPVDSVTKAYQVLLSQLTRKINSASFEGIPAGCCRFMGARGKPSGNRWPIDYSFEVRWPETVTIGDIGPITKEGYQHISVYRAKFTDSTAKRIIEIPWVVYIQDVIEKRPFALLGL